MKYTSVIISQQESAKFIEGRAEPLVHHLRKKLEINRRLLESQKDT